MTRLGILLATLLLFASTPAVVARLHDMPPRWRLRLAFISLLGLGSSATTLLAAILLPEVLIIEHISQLWQACSRALSAIRDHPLERMPSIIAAGGLAIVLARLLWALLAAARATHRARVRGGHPRWRLAGRASVYELPVSHPEGYSVGVLRPQVIVSQGLLDVLDDDERRAVLLHEEGHVRGRHHLMLRVGGAIGAALRPLTPTKAALALLEQSAEETADEYAAKGLGPETVASGVSKAALAALESPVGALSVTGGSDVPYRVRRLLSPPPVPRWVPAACLLAAVLLLGGLALTQAIAGLAVVAAAHHVVGLGVAVACPLTR